MTDRPFRDEPTEVLLTALGLANRHAEQAARFNPVLDGPLPAVVRLFRDELQHRGEDGDGPTAPAVPAGQAPATDQTVAPVKQRADCTELEWAEQERARFERLYTRETVRADLAEQRADTAARDADIYQRRLERLGEGYTRERHRAEEAEAEAERLRTDRAATCICGHTEAQHFEDACLVCDCGDFLVPEAAREVIARWRTAALQARADRAAVLREAADRLAQVADELADTQESLRDAFSLTRPVIRDAECWHAAARELRRMADETPGVRHAPGTAILCPDCRAKGHPVCTSGEAPVTSREPAVGAQQPKEIQCADAFWPHQPHPPHGWQQGPDTAPVRCPGITTAQQPKETRP